MNHPKQWKQHCQGSGTVSSPGLSSSWLNWCGELWWERLLDGTAMTGAERSYPQHHEEWLGFTGASEAVMWNMDKPPWKGALGPWVRPTAAWYPHQPQDIKLRLMCHWWGQEYWLGRGCSKNETNGKKVNEAGLFIWRGLGRRGRGAMMVKESNKN